MYYLLIQSLIAKRPYNLFHRKNLYMRFSDVKRKFGNKTTWDKSFIEHMLNYRKELINMIQQKKTVVSTYKVINYSYSEIPKSIIDSIDTVYIDPPYFKKNNKNSDYLKYYHFIEGFINYDNWNENIDTKKDNLQLKNNDRFEIVSAIDMFTMIVKKFQKKNLIISYKNDAYPSIDEINEILKKYYSTIKIEYINYKYALAKSDSQEVVFIALFS